MLAASEVATNVVRHVATSFAVTVVGWPGHLRVEFADRSRALPAVQRTPVGEHGRGLLILDAITDRWGVEPTPGGKVVWFEVSDRASAS